MDASERALLSITVRDAVADARSTAPDAGVDHVLLGLGWLEMLDAEPRDSIDVVFSVLGETNGTAAVLDDVMTAALGIDPRADRTVMLPRFATSDCPGRVVAGEVHAVGVTSSRIATAVDLALVAEGDQGLQRVVVPVTATMVTPVRGIDPDAGLHVVEVRHPVTDAAPLEPVAWGSTVAAGRRALAHQTAGACRTMLELARTHAVQRVQFDTPIGRFQAVQHRLADALVAIEALEATLVAAWDEPGPMTAALAKAAAGRTARTVGAHCQQVLAGIGFTTDHPFHRFLKRTMALDGLLGSSDRIVLDLGHELLSTRTVPTLIEL
jgi:hypothetical protein